MVTYAASLFRAIAPIAGHQYQDLLRVTDNKPRGLFMHHSSNDNMVKITGCCIDTSMPHCCCGISALADECTPATSVFEQWASHVNQCSEGTHVSFQDEAITCHTGSGNCLANATLCIHANSGHFNVPSFAKAFPMTNEIADFFAQDACAINGGEWSSSNMNCSCKNGAKGTYCLNKLPTVSQHASVNEQNVDGGARIDLNSLIVVLVGIALLVVLITLIKSKARYSGWTKVSVEDEENIEMKKPTGLGFRSTT